MFSGPPGLQGLRAFSLEMLQDCPPGTGVRVAIVDSGIAPMLLGEEAPRRSFHVRRQGLLTVVERCAPGDVHYHGTAVASVLREIAPEASLVSVRVVDEQGRGSSEHLRAALEFCIRERFDVVNLSLGTRKRELLLDVYDLVDQAAVAGVTLVAATDNQGAPDYPAACTSLLSVDRLETRNPFALRFRSGHRVAFLARGHDVEVYSPGGTMIRVSGASFACPHVTAFASRLRAAWPALHPFEVKTALHAAAIRSEAGYEAAPPR
ncbi:MAG: S8 family serine peptidase [Myxococcales bacterium]|nr:S8 family serine peptidase [Polyangiaceae bacterium]MDW8251364.1 S8 family serine peptidase [Myxococcales bacterium]